MVPKQRMMNSSLDDLHTDDIDEDYGIFKNT